MWLNDLYKNDTEALSQTEETKELKKLGGVFENIMWTLNEAIMMQEGSD